jgi:hypothetical protein
MLSAHNRKLYTDALRPPYGMVFDEGIGLTYSLDLDTLLTVPLQLALFSGERPGEDLKDGIAVLEALRRTTEKLLVFCQQGRIHVPRGDQVLYGLLESVVVEAGPRERGAFHPKLWAIRFVDPSGERPPSLRLLVLSRNITFDRSWDICLRLEGTPGKARVSGNTGLAKLLGALPELSKTEIPPEAEARLARMAKDLRCVEWELPEGFETVQFHSFGVGGKTWAPARSERLAIVSPFLEPRALDHLVKTSAEPATLVSRQEELDRVTHAGGLAPFGEIRVLYEAAETEDGEEVDENETGLVGLHAKVYVSERKGRTRVAVGSANATAAALLGGGNVELLAELEGPSRRVGGVSDLMGEDGLGDVLDDYEPSAAPVDLDSAERAAELALEDARDALGRAGMRVECEGSGEEWTLALAPGAPVQLEGIAELTVRPVSLVSEHRKDGMALARGQTVRVGPCAMASITGLIAFDLLAEAHPTRQRFVLNLPLQGAPEGRFAAVTRAVVANREGFLRYLLLLLAEFGDDGLSRWIPGATRGGNRWRKAIGFDDLPLLEHLVRALTRDPERLGTVASLIADLGEGGQTDDLLSAEFLDLWKSFEPLLEPNGP